ncbi:hypothetical protein SEA_ATUIN_67 [Arthrobacter phage Atuin]|nr:hypothetical protein SEA_ATUIN_166 [Arthrobacter phage Atuin]
MAKDFDLPRPAYIRLDLFPASVNDMGEELRVIVTDSVFYVFDETLTGPEAVISEPLVSFEGSNQTGYTVVTESNTYAVARALNCGCGSRLRGIHPFMGVPYASQLK